MSAHSGQRQGEMVGRHRLLGTGLLVHGWRAEWQGVVNGPIQVAQVVLPRALPPTEAVMLLRPYFRALRGRSSPALEVRCPPVPGYAETLRHLCRTTPVPLLIDGRWVRRPAAPGPFRWERLPAAAPPPLTEMEMEALLALRRLHGATARELAAVLGRSPRGACERLQRLRLRGLVTRTAEGYAPTWSALGLLGEALGCGTEALRALGRRRGAADGRLHRSVVRRLGAHAARLWGLSADAYWPEPWLGPALKPDGWGWLGGPDGFALVVEVSRRRDGAREVAARLTRQFRQTLRWFGETPLVFLCLTHAVVAARGVFPRPPGHAALVVVGVRPFRLPPRLPRPVFGAVCQEVIA